MQSFKEKYGPWALVTGASSGIGKQYASQLAAKGLGVVLVERNREKLLTLEKELHCTRSVFVDVSFRQMDYSRLSLRNRLGEFLVCISVETMPGKLSLYRFCDGCK